MLGFYPVPSSSKAFGMGLEDLARAGLPPIVLQDCLRFLALKALTHPNLFTTAPIDRKNVISLKQAYESGKRPLRSSKHNALLRKDPPTVSALLLSWLHSLPGPLLPADILPQLLNCWQESSKPPHNTDPQQKRLLRLDILRSLFRCVEPFVVEAVYPLFELLHHYWINQADREAALATLSSVFAPPLFGDHHHNADAEECDGDDDDAGTFFLIKDIVAFIIVDYRPLFTQPFNLKRYEEDCARAAAAAAAAATANATSAFAPPPSYLTTLNTTSTTTSDSATMQDALLTPKRLANLSIMVPHSSSDDISSSGTSSDGSGSSSPVVTPTAYDDGAVPLMSMMMGGQRGGEYQQYNHHQYQQEVYGHDGVQFIVGALVDDTVASLFGSSNNSAARTVPVVVVEGRTGAMMGDGDMSTSPVDVLCCNGE